MPNPITRAVDKLLADPDTAAKFGQAADAHATRLRIRELCDRADGLDADGDHAEATKLRNQATYEEYLSRETPPELKELEQIADGQLSAGNDVTLLSKMRNGRYLNDTTFPELRWIVPGVVPEGLSVLIGAPKIGKSWLGLGFTLAAASGGRALGQIDVGEPRPVLHLALEDGHRRMQDRGRQLLAGDAFPPLFDYLLELEPGMVVATIVEWLMQPQIRLNQQPPMVLLDTLGKVMPDSRPGESAYQRDYRIAGQLKRISDDVPGMGILVLHHDRKAGSDDFVDTVSGTNGIAGAADTILALGRQRMETSGLLKVTGRDVDENEYAMTTEGGRWSLDGTLEQAADMARAVRATEGLADRSAEILAVVQSHPEGVTAADVEAELPGVERVGTYLSRLVKAGRICRPVRGTYAPR